MNNSQKIICPLCDDTVDKLLYRFHIDDEKNVIEKIKQQNLSWTESDGTCSRCVDYYHTAIIREQRILPQIGPHFPIKSADDFIILPTPLRVDSNPRYTGKGVTICFIDSGFYPHPDLVANKNRIKKYIDITGSSKALSFEEDLGEIIDSSWHGTMTAVVCAGDGHLSRGLYKGIASDAELVLIKVQDENGKITTDNIVKALQWVLENHEVYDIRIVNMSFGDDELLSYKTSRVDQLAETLIEKNIVVVAAVGNDDNGNIHPPANSLNVIAIGGIDDDNDLENGIIKAYHSTYGITTDALLKPELIAHAVWIAAPILPNTKEQKEAKALYHLICWLDHPRPGQFSNETANHAQEYIHQTQLDKEILTWNEADIRKAIIRRTQTCKYISPNYMHVDGTSFAAPIVSSVIAQLLEVNPFLSVRDVRNILFSTAKRIKSIASERQGFGVIQPRKALLKTLQKENIMKQYSSPFINKQKKTIEFFIENTCAEEISLAGSFNHWANDVLLMEPVKNGFWKIEIPMLPAGKYQYKFLIDHKHWMEDVDNPYREPDGFNGFNSILVVEYQN
jgi:serine protease AprX